MRLQLRELPRQRSLSLRKFILSEVSLVVFLVEALRSNRVGLDKGLKLD